MIKQVAHVCISAPDLAASEGFYCGVLGLEKTFDFIKDDQLYGFYVGTGNTTFLEVFIQNDDISQEHPLIRHFCLEVENIDDTIESVRSKGWAISDKKLGRDQSWQAWIEDPAGVRIELHQYTPESSQFTGRNCIVNW